jgi:hypothetical protein
VLIVEAFPAASVVLIRTLWLPSARVPVASGLEQLVKEALSIEHVVVPALAVKVIEALVVVT